MSKQLDRDKVFKEDIKSDYLWCLHCERAYKRGMYRVVRGLQLCPYDDCDGDTVTDAWDWQKICDGHPDYPEIPEEGEVYLLYSDS